jgi:beta-glucosidase
MPWLDDVQGVLEAWYPGQEDGIAITAILFGAVDPSGRLPVTFPTSLAAQPVSTPTQFPGVKDVVSFGIGTAALDVGYRWYQAHDVAPLFPFGYGLDYTTFSLSGAHYVVGNASINVTLNVSNIGDRTGVDVVQAYVKDPAKLDEPPEQLKSLLRVKLAPGASKTVALSIPISSLNVYVDGAMRTFAGTYAVSIGQSSANLPLTMQVKIPLAITDSLNAAGLTRTPDLEHVLKG